MTRIRGSWILRQIAGRALLPHHVVRWVGLRRGHRRVPTVHANAQLRLYNQILPGDFLHYGYFDDPKTPPEAVSFAGIERAQRRYAEKIVELLERPGLPVLDVGSGMGGMLGLLRDRGHDVTGLTPDRFQTRHIRRAYPGVPLIQRRFEEMPVRDHRGRYGAVIHAESLQYMKPREVFPIVREILAPGGAWIIADYFRTEERQLPGGPGTVPDPGEPTGPRVPDDHAAVPNPTAGPGPASRPDPAPPRAHRSGWLLADFRRRLAAAGFEITRETDITANVLPTLGFAHLLATRLGLPAIDYARNRLRAKSPVLHYVLRNILASAHDAAHRNADIVDPALFAATRRYLLLACRKSRTAKP